MTAWSITNLTLLHIIFVSPSLTLFLSKLCLLNVCQPFSFHHTSFQSILLYISIIYRKLDKRTDLQYSKSHHSPSLNFQTGHTETGRFYVWPIKNHRIIKNKQTERSAILTRTVTTRSTTPRMLFSNFLSVSVPFKPWTGSHVASCNVHTHTNTQNS